MPIDLDEAFKKSQQWKPDVPLRKGIFRQRLVCNKCHNEIRASDNGYRCKCSQWRMVNDPANPYHIADRRKLSKDEL